MKKLKLLVSLHTRDNDFQIAQAQSAEETGRKLGIDVETIFADNDAVHQSTQILKAIQASTDSRPDAVILEPVSGTALPQVARAAGAAGIGWVLLNRTPEYLSELRSAAKAPVFAVVSDHLEIGRIQGRQFSALLPKGGSILYIEGPVQSSSAQKRTAGMLETKPSNIRVATLKGKWTEESAEKAVLSWLSLATSQTAVIDLVGAQDDSMAMGVRNTVQKITDEQKRAYWLRLPFTGCDGLPATGQKWVREGLLVATVCIPPLAGTAIEILAKAIRDGIHPPEQTLTQSFSFPPLEALARRQAHAARK
jgi:ribose transport system substrate-binding protein